MTSKKTSAEERQAQAEQEEQEIRKRYERLHPDDPHTAQRLFADWKSHRAVERGDVPPADLQGAGIPATNTETTGTQQA